MSKKIYFVLAIAVFLLATTFRLYHIGYMPGGLFPDEAANGLDINLMESGHLQPFYERGNGREALFFYMLWGGVKLLGRSPYTHHAVVALIGSLAVILCFFVTRSLFKGFSKEVPQEAPVLVRAGRAALVEKKIYSLFASDYIALLATFIMAVSTWHLVLSRTAFRANLIPVFCALTFWCLLRIPLAQKRSHQYLWSIAFGASFALGFYTYIAYRIMAPLLFLLVIWPLFAAIKSQGFKTIVQKYSPLLVASIVSFTIFIFPLARYFYQHPAAFVGRSGQVSVFNPELNGGDLAGTVLEVGRLSLIAYFTDGDLNWRQNISGFPFLSPLVSPFFALGLLLVLYGAIRYILAPIRQSSRFPQFMLAGWFFAFLLPVITTAEGIPHGLRSIGTIPAVFIITAYGLYVVGHFVWRMVNTYQHGGVAMERALRFSLKALVVSFVLALPLQTFAGYFIYAANSPENFYAFRSDLTSVSRYLNEHGNRNTTYLVLDKFSVQTVDYLTTVDGKHWCDRDKAYRPANCVDNPKNNPYMQVDPEDSWLADFDVKNGHKIYENGLKPGMQVVFTQSSVFDIKKFKLHHPRAKLETEIRNKFGQVVVAVYRIE